MTNSDPPDIPDADTVQITVYTREECHLCSDAIETVRNVQAASDREITVRIVDVDADPELRDEYGDRVPYVFVDGAPAFKFHVDEEELRSVVADAQ